MKSQQAATQGQNYLLALAISPVSGGVSDNGGDLS